MIEIRRLRFYGRWEWGFALGVVWNPLDEYPPNLQVFVGPYSLIIDAVGIPPMGYEMERGLPLPWYWRYSRWMPRFVRFWWIHLCQRLFIRF